MLKRFVVLIYFLIPTICWPQSQVTRIPFGTTTTPLAINQDVTALAIRFADFQGDVVILTIDDTNYELPFDPDGESFSYFLSLAKPLRNPTINQRTKQNSTLFLINSGDSPKIESESHSFRKSDDCLIEFEAIPQSEWRAGLDAPSYTRSFTNVSHVVIHHAAGSNTNSNYTQVVRDIYEYHRDVNGWSDIGYNYLIAQDGSIYAGRDPGAGEQDNVLGAHFCGKNGGTMGICLLGNFETATPSVSSLESLESLVAFKIVKEELDPLGESLHSGSSLGSIVGHRDGCSTACPGENVYGLLEEFRYAVEERMISCEERGLAFSASSQTPKIGEYITFYNESVGYESYKWILENAEKEAETWVSTGSTRWSSPGDFDVSLIGYYGTEVDTLTAPDFISIEGPVIFPTLVSDDYLIYLNAGESVSIQSIFSMDGRETVFHEVNATQYQLHPAEPGLYLIQLSNGDTERIIVL